MIRCALVGTVLALVAFSVAPAAAQTTEQSTDIQVLQIDDSALPEVKLLIGLPTGFAGSPIDAGAVSLAENGVPSEIALEPVGGSSLDVVLAIDTSGSMRGEALAEAQLAAARFLDALGPESRVALVGFGADATLEAPFGVDRAEVNTAIAGLESRGETSLYDAVVLASDLFGPTSQRRAVVVLTDGADTVSTAGVAQAAAALARAEVDLYAIGLATSDSEFSSLNELAAGAASGRVLAADEAGQLSEVYSEVAARLTSQYWITYESAAAGRTQIDIEVSTQSLRATASVVTVLGSISTPVAERSEPELAVLEPVVAPSPHGIGGLPWVLPVGVATLALAVAMIAGAVLFPGRNPRRLVDPRTSLREGSREATSVLASARASLAATVDSVLRSRDNYRGLDRRLDRAGIALRPGEFVVAVLGISLATGVLATLAVGPLVGLIGVGLGVSGSRWFLARRARLRQAAFADQLGPTLQLLAGNLRAGHGLMRSIDVISEECEEPTASELKRVVAEDRLGRDATVSLQAMADRVDNDDFRWVIQAIEIHREVGGDLAEVLDKVHATLSDRNRIRRQIQVLSADGRLSAVVLVALPFVVAGMLWIVNRGYVSELFDTSLGRYLLAYAGVSIVIGVVFIRRIVRLVF